MKHQLDLEPYVGKPAADLLLWRNAKASAAALGASIAAFVVVGLVQPIWALLLARVLAVCTVSTVIWATIAPLVGRCAPGWGGAAR
jgi:hypothetical protein